jgi:hypothetical protein
MRWAYTSRTCSHFWQCGIVSKRGTLPSMILLEPDFFADFPGPKRFGTYGAELLKLLKQGATLSSKINALLLFAYVVA